MVKIETTDDLKKHAVATIAERARGYERYEEYYLGNHPLTFATEKFRNAFGSLFREIADNLCQVVVDAVADRLQIIGFDVEQGQEEAADRAWELWQANRMDRRSGEIHSEALRAGDAYARVWPNGDNEPIIYPNKGRLCTVNYAEDKPGLVAWAAKLWQGDDEYHYLTLYFADRIEKYVAEAKEIDASNARSFKPREVPGERWPLPNPWGVVPMFHFANNALIDAWGQSELANVIPLQNALNKALADMLVAMEFVAYPQRFATGIEVDIDPVTGKPKTPFEPGVDRFWSVANPDVKFGEFRASDTTDYLAIQDSLRSEIARVSGTPLHYMMMERGGWPSGEAMKTAEARFVAKVEDRQVAFGNVWEDVARLCLRMDGAADTFQLSALWQDAAPRSEREMAEIAMLKQQLGVPDDQILLELGYPPEKVDEFRQMRVASGATFGEQLLSAFERGE